MNRHINLLFGVGFLQLLLIALFWMGESESTQETTKLLAIDVDEATVLKVSDGQHSVEIVKHAQGWQVAGAPADAEKVLETLEKLAKLEISWPVASTTESHERFEVEADNFQRKVEVLGAAGTQAVLFMGTSPGYQRVHARSLKGTDVHAVALSNYEFSTDVDPWVAKNTFQMSEVPQRVSVEHIGGRTDTLSKSDDGWLFNNLAAKPDAAETYMNRFTNLRVLGLAEKDRDTEAVAKLIVEDGAGASQSLLISRQVTDQNTEGEAASSEYFLQAVQSQAAESSIQYRLATYLAEQLLMSDTDLVLDVEVDKDNNGENSISAEPDN